jgi:hypothetical protein
MVACFPKTGTHFVGSVVAEVLGTRLKMLTMFPMEKPCDNRMFEQAPIGGHFFNLSKANFDFMADNDWKIVQGVRDPRDQIISWYMYYTGANKDHRDGWFLTSLSKDDAIMALIQGYQNEHQIRAPMVHKYRSWLKIFEDREVPILRVKYEELISKCALVICDISRHVRPNDVRHLDTTTIIEATRIDKPHPNVPVKVKRKGVPGEWKDHFTQAHIREFEKTGGKKLLEELGYD